MNITSKINYPSYNLIICCNSIGYVPMMILSVNSTFSFCLIPMNFLLGLIISILVGLNMTFNLYIIKQIRSIKLSRRNLLGSVGISSGLFVGCPTCAGSFFYSIAGFSSLITFSFKCLPGSFYCYRHTFVNNKHDYYGKGITRKILEFL